MTTPPQHPKQQVTPNGHPIQPPQAKKPWYQKWWVIAIAAVLVLGIFINLFDGGDDKDPQSETAEETPQSETAEETPQSETLAPDQVGQLLSVATANLELEGFEVEAVSDNGKSIWDQGNWEVTEQKQNGNKVLLTVTKPEEEQEAKDSAPTEESTDSNSAPAPASAPTAPPATTTNSQGLDEYGAVHACGDLWETILKNEYPASKVKIHTIVGILAVTLDEDDTWFVKLEASVDSNRLNVECSVGGSLDQPIAEPLAVY